ncbi:Uncharacterised protein [Mycolicibacterium aurum]|uniref:Transmembrane protein n=1 Tax=Mycolicibacterium aurum TaxID=1791 RepID=A0A448IXJ3_MYCAU|nr:hypothetical protein [Mycolicibacterium aurum]VEG57135.1 Uncharacterised protein [Mycolicibacterium aurum]
MNRINWPTAFVIVFGAVPFAVFIIAVLAVYPLVGWPLVAGAVVAHGAYLRHRRDTALAERAAIDFPRNAEIVAQRLPEPRTVPLRQARR